MLQFVHCGCSGTRWWRRRVPRAVGAGALRASLPRLIKCVHRVPSGYGLGLCNQGILIDDVISTIYYIYNWWVVVSCCMFCSWFFPSQGKPAKEHKSGRSRLKRNAPQCTCFTLFQWRQHDLKMLWGEALLPGLLQLAQASHSLVILVALGHAAEAYHLWFSSAGRRTPSLVPAHCQAAVVVRVPKETFACPALRLRKARWRNGSAAGK